VTDVDERTEELLLVADLQPAPHATEGAERTASDEAVVKLLMSRVNRIAVRRPAVWSYDGPADPFEALGVTWPGGADLYWVVGTFGCLPDPDCRFTWLNVQLEFTGEHDAGAALVCQLYPSRDEDVVKVVDKKSLSLDLSATIAGVTSPKATPSLSTEHTYDRRQYRTAAYGKGGSRPEWRFRATEVNPEIIGDFSVVALVATPLGQASRGSISLSAQVQLKTALPKLPLILSRTAADVATNSFRIPVA